MKPKAFGITLPLHQYWNFLLSERTKYAEICSTSPKLLGIGSSQMIEFENQT